MKKIMLLLFIGILLTSLVFAQTYKASTSSSFTIANESSDESSSSDWGNSDYIIVWSCVGIALFLGIVYIVFKKSSKTRSRKKKY